MWTDMIFLFQSNLTAVTTKLTITKGGKQHFITDEDIPSHRQEFHLCHFHTTL